MEHCHQFCKWLNREANQAHAFSQLGFTTHGVPGKGQGRGVLMVGKRDVVPALTNPLIWWRERETYQILINKCKIKVVTTCLETVDKSRRGRDKASRRKGQLS